MALRTALLAAILAAAFPAAAIVTRPDRDDAEYRELASRYASALELGGFGEGVLVAPRWLLTSASVAQALREAHVARLRIAGLEHGIEGTYVAPDPRHADIALLLLREPVAGVQPTPLHRAPDEAGKAVVVAGHGASGAIGGAHPVRDGQRRAAINTVDGVDPGWLVLRIKGADDASDLQGAAAAGDEGAPAYLESQGRLSVAGIAQGPRGGAVPKIGDEDRYARVSSFIDWIDETMFRAAANEASAATARPPRRR